FTPEEVTATVLGQLRASAEAALRETITGAVLAYPSHFNEAQRQGLRDAARQAGLTLYQCVSEPAAAQLAYDAALTHAALAGTDVNRLLIDLGGNSLRVHAYAVRGGLYTRLASQQANGLGGRALDRALAAHLQREFERRHRIDLSDRPRSIAKLVLACEATRRSLGMRQSAPCSVESIADGMDLNVNVHRAVFESAVAPIVQQCMAVIDAVLAEAGWTATADEENAKVRTSGPDEVLLLGGASRLPVFQSRLRARFTRPETRIRTEVEPDEAVALGCAVQAGLIAECPELCPVSVSAASDPIVDALQEDLSPAAVPHLAHAVGVLDANQVFHVVLPAGTPLPTKR
ncbi:heat shock protein 70 family, partial [Thamnocephalis sphaerospora]